jgi:hypothetical protein
MKPLASEMIDIAKDAARIAAQEESKIIDRIHYIIETLYKTFDCELSYWCFPDAGEGEVGNLWNHLQEYGINVESEPKDDFPDSGMNIIDKFGDEWSFEGLLPKRWLFEDFETEIVIGKTKFEGVEALKKEKAAALKAAKKLRKAELLESAKKKLSKEELVALGVK